ncbi:MAG: transcriptional regulator [Cytophagales bacterium]|nr:transcriptional regulator [Armatimonadota bacterium]
MREPIKEQIKTLAELDRVIHEPARLMLVAILSEVEEVDFLYLLRETGMSKGNLSSHLARLEAALYVEVTKTYRGKIQMTLCRLTDRGRAAFEQYRTMLKASLEAVGAAPSRKEGLGMQPNPAFSFEPRAVRL